MLRSNGAHEMDKQSTGALRMISKVTKCTFMRNDITGNAAISACEQAPSCVVLRLIPKPDEIHSRAATARV